MIEDLSQGDYIALQAELDRFVKNHLPLGQAMGLEVSHYDAKSIALSAPLALNDNDKGTAFGGSLYCSAVMAAWSFFYLRCLQYNLKEGMPNIVVSKGGIEYLAPVTSSNIIATCENTDKTMWDEFLARYEQKGSAKVCLSSTINSEVNGVEQVAVKFTGTYALIGYSST
ncbi:thioesterase domain-containing protein [Pseudomonadales bacterium]|nr:thioesterase domain-containing protein [Pseudomonadales bacterium]